MMVMGGRTSYTCFLHGRQTARGCVIECPVCHAIKSMKHYDTPEDAKAFEEGGWKGSWADEPWRSEYDPFDVGYDDEF